MSHPLDSVRLDAPFRMIQRDFSESIIPKPKKQKDFIPCCVSGGIGDLILAIPLLESIEKKIGPIRVFSNHYGIYSFLSGNEGRTFDGYDYWININSVVDFVFQKNFSGFPFEGLNELFISNRVFTSDVKWKRFTQYHPYLDNEMAVEATKAGLTRTTLSFHMLGLEPRKKRITFHPGPYDWEPFITVHDGYEVNQTQIEHRSTKGWNIRHWARFVEKIKKQFPDLMVVQLGGPTSRSIPGVDVNLVGKIPIQESFKVLSKSQLHIDGDSGLVHAANLFGVRSVVMFGPTPAQFFGHEENVNISSPFCGGCWWLSDHWMKSCILGHRTPACMDSIKPETVFSEVEKILSLQPWTEAGEFSLKWNKFK